MQTSTAMPQPEQNAVPRCSGAFIIDEAVLTAFDAEIHPFEPAADLLSVNSQQGLSAAMSAFVAALSKLNADRISRKFNWYERFTGLDIEARIEFDLAAHGLSSQMVELGIAAGRARQILATLQSERPRLKAIQSHHAELIDWATRMLVGNDPDDYFVGRFQRRLANLEALAASDRMTEAQIDPLAG